MRGATSAETPSAALRDVAGSDIPVSGESPELRKPPHRGRAWRLMATRGSRQGSDGPGESRSPTDLCTDETNTASAGRRSRRLHRRLGRGRRAGSHHRCDRSIRSCALAQRQGGQRQGLGVAGTKKEPLEAAQLLQSRIEEEQDVPRVSAPTASAYHRSRRLRLPEPRRRQ